MQTPLEFIKWMLSTTSIGGIVSKREINTLYKKMHGQTAGLSTVMTHLSKLVIAGYLEVTETPGWYRLKTQLPADLTYDMLVSGSKQNRQLALTLNPLDSQVGGGHYRQLNYQPIELICKLELSFIQGNIVKYISRHKNKNKAEDVKKVIHYAEFAISFNNEKHVEKHLHKEVAVYCANNNLELLEAQIVRLAIENRYTAIIQKCKELLKDHYQVIE